MKGRCKECEMVRKEEVRYCISKVGGSWEVEDVKVDLVWS